ncbi:hypothetical protein GCM10017600_55580 [Streptosporangium carneum]|uniref:Uncharacterized protein n=1 Tax=Streptosporangium carneum TaxID=47481 RepID=A0A9W6I4X1_9ACTN|nr:hypothetical protein GCM10017600_55580 [Streptosporangium carneum]
MLLAPAETAPVPAGSPLPQALSTSTPPTSTGRNLPDLRAWNTLELLSSPAYAPPPASVEQS